MLGYRHSVQIIQWYHTRLVVRGNACVKYVTMAMLIRWQLRINPRLFVHLSVCILHVCLFVCPSDCQLRVTSVSCAQFYVYMWCVRLDWNIHSRVCVPHTLTSVPSVLPSGYRCLSVCLSVCLASWLTFYPPIYLHSTSGTFSVICTIMFVT